MKDTSRIVLLMTATIAPRNCPDAQFTPEERRCRYLRAFSWYLSKLTNAKKRCPYDAIVFAENSGSDLRDFEQLVPYECKENVEFVSAPVEIFPPNLRKNNEFVLIDYALNNSRLLAEEIAGFFKVTGRYYFRNIDLLLSDVRKEKEGLELFCDQIDHRLYSTFRLKGCEQDGETRFFFCSIKFWRDNFYGYFKRNPEFKRVEEVMFETAVKNYGKKNCKFRFAHEPLLGGHQFAQGGWGYAFVHKMYGYKDVSKIVLFYLLSKMDGRFCVAKDCA